MTDQAGTNQAETPKSSAKQELPSLDVKASHIARDWKHSAPLIGCRYDPSGRYVFASSMDRTIQRWDLQDDQHATFAGHESWLRGLGFSPDGQQLYSAGYEGQLCFWEATANPKDTESAQPTKRIAAHQGWIRWLAVSPDGNLIATTGNDLLVKLWSAKTGELVSTLEGHEKHVYSLLFHPSGNVLLSGDLKGVVNQWEIPSGKRIRSLDAKALHTYHGGQQVDYGGVRCMTLNDDQTQLACGGIHKATNPFAGVQEPLVLVFDWNSGEQIRTHEATGIPTGMLWRVLFQPDGTLIAGIGGNNGFIVFWSDDKTEFHKLKMPQPVLDLDRHPKGLELATAHSDGRIRITRMAAKA